MFSMLLGPQNLLVSSNAEVNELIDRSVLDTIDMNSSLNHLPSIVNSIFESDENSSMRIFVKVGCSHYQLTKTIIFKLISLLHTKNSQMLT